jgi:hypothetical protein
MKIRIIAILAFLLFIPLAGITRTKTVELSYSTKPIVIKKKWGISAILIKNCSAEFIGLEANVNGETEAEYHSFKKTRQENLFLNTFLLDLENIGPGNYTIYAMACYQAWEMHVEIR